MPVAFRDDGPPLICWALALMIWNISVLGEGLADSQMERFRSNPANKGLVCRDGLWRYSRHPNYFFECLHWAAYMPLAVGAPWGWVSVLAPVVMALLLMKLSGVPMLEEEMARRKPGYAEYMRTTSALIPWPPKRGRSSTFP
jgi:steroid 5-alpha reductase family enzyme